MAVVLRPGDSNDLVRLLQARLNFDQPPPLPTNLPFFYGAAGTWSTPFMGPQFDVGWRLEQMRRVRNQPVGYPAAGFPYPNPFMSYNESVALGVAELVRLILMNAGKFYLCGHSQGAEVVVRTLRLMLPGQPLAHRAGDLELPFALQIISLIQSDEFLALLNLANTPETFAKVVRTAVVVGDFIVRNPHIHYHDWLSFNGASGVDRAVQIVSAGPPGGP